MQTSSDSDMPDLDSIKQSLMKVIDQMDQMESQRLLPDGHPLKAKAPEPAAGVDPNSAPSLGGPSDGAIGDDEPDTDDSGLDSGVLSQLMDKASSVDDSGASPDDEAEANLPPEIVAAVAAKKKVKPV